MKRFTETLKWADPWFRALEPEVKLLWIWLLDNCDISGVIRPDLKLASFQIGQLVDESHVLKLGDRIAALPDGKLHIPKFVGFQFGQILSDKSNVHRSVIRISQSHNLPLANPIPSLSQALAKAQALGEGSPTPKDKAKDKDKEREGVQGEGKNRKPQKLPDGEWIKSLTMAAAYSGIDVPREFSKAEMWIGSKPGRKLTRQFFVNWLNRIEPAMKNGKPYKKPEPEIFHRTGEGNF